jgi:hypothetical protein
VGVAVSLESITTWNVLGEKEKFRENLVFSIEMKKSNLETREQVERSSMVLSLWNSRYTKTFQV